MGYELTLLILRAEMWSETSPAKQDIARLWKIQSALNIGRVSSFRNRAHFLAKPPRERAALQFVSYIWGPLTKAADSTKCTAPAFGIRWPEVGVMTSARRLWRENMLKDRRRKAIHDYIEPLEKVTGHLVPSLTTMIQHNAGRRDKKVRDSQSQDLVFAFPLVWFPCSTAASWICENEGKKGFEHLDQSDAAARAFVSTWKACLTEMGKADAKCLFLFEELGPVDVI